jgi:hypothetical protein
MGEFELASNIKAAREKGGMEEVRISNRSFGEYDDSAVFLTPELAEQLRARKNRYGKTEFEALKAGQLITGLKHLIEQIQTKNRKAKLVLTLGRPKKEDDKYFISYEEYGRRGFQTRIQIGRTAKLSLAKSYLERTFPTDFPPSAATDSAEALLHSQTGQIVLVDKTTELLERVSKERRRSKALIRQLKDLQRMSNIAYYREKLEELRSHLERNHRESWWQNWIYSNNWLFGVNYNQPISKQRVGLDNIPDFLFPSLDGFIDILEIKRPSHPVIIEDPSHPRTFVWSSETNRAIGQVVVYIQELEDHRREVAERLNEEFELIMGHKLKTVRPRAFILIGRSDDMPSPEKEGFRKLNHTLHGIEVLTYTDLVTRAEALIALYGSKRRE